MPAAKALASIQTLPNRRDPDGTVPRRGRERNVFAARNSTPDGLRWPGLSLKPSTVPAGRWLSRGKSSSAFALASPRKTCSRIRGHTLPNANGVDASSPSIAIRTRTVICWPRRCGLGRRDSHGDGPLHKVHWKWDLGGLRMPLYRWPNLIDERIVLVLEGEKAVNRVRSLGIAATCPPSGTSTWLKEFAEMLWRSGAVYVIVSPDNDKSGRRHAERVVRMCHGYRPRLRGPMNPVAPCAPNYSSLMTFRMGATSSTGSTAATTVDELIEKIDDALDLNGDQAAENGTCSNTGP